ncbi:hypothetical protein [Georgenia faecalis]|uniref:Uncharacterized protein n=2 Tax=Georgenia faecalis TaxID=2483799 RepID=A0ABV9D9Z8_9MICO
MSSLVRYAAEEAEHPLPMDPILYGVVAMAALLFLLLATYAFRSVHTRRR